MEQIANALAGQPIIVGAGRAGLLTALHLVPEPVIVLAKAPLALGAASAWAQGGIAAAVGADDDPALHAADTIATGAALCDASMVERITAAAPEAVDVLARWGVVFDRSHVGVLRDHAGLRAAIEALRTLAFGNHSIDDPALVGLIMATAALLREESGGGHRRANFPGPAHLGRWLRLTLCEGDVAAHFMPTGSTAMAAGV